MVGVGGGGGTMELQSSCFALRVLYYMSTGTIPLRWNFCGNVFPGDIAGRD